MDEGGQLAAEYSSKQSKETQMAHKADRKLGNLAVHAEHGLLRAGLGRRAFEGQVGQPSQNRTQNRPPPKKKRKHTKQPTQTRPGRRTEKDSRGGRAKSNGKHERKKEDEKKKRTGNREGEGETRASEAGAP